MVARVAVAADKIPPPPVRAGDLPTTDRLAAFGRVAPEPRDHGKISVSPRHPPHCNRRPQHGYYVSELLGTGHCDQPRRSYECKRAEGKRHTRAALTFARRCVNVLWAFPRDQRHYEPAPPTARAA